MWVSYAALSPPLGDIVLGDHPRPFSHRKTTLESEPSVGELTPAERTTRQ